jgi:hypothetical protein
LHHPACFNPDPTILYGIASAIAGDVELMFPTEEEAQGTLAEVLADEPDLRDALWMQAIDLGETSLN